MCLGRMRIAAELIITKARRTYQSLEISHGRMEARVHALRVSSLLTSRLAALRFGVLRTKSGSVTDEDRLFLPLPGLFFFFCLVEILEDVGVASSSVGSTSLTESVLDN